MLLGTHLHCLPQTLTSLHLQLLKKRLQDGQAQGELGVLLDGFPRTRRQAQMLALIADTQLAVNLSLRPEVIAVALFFVVDVLQPFCLSVLRSWILAATLQHKLVYQCALLAGVDCQVLGEAGVPGLWKELQHC